MQNEISKSLAILLTPNGFSYCTLLENEKGKKYNTPNEFRVDEIYPQQIEKEIENELKTNLIFHQPYQHIHLAFMSPKMQVVPTDFMDLPTNALLQLNPIDEDKNVYLDSPLQSTDASIVYEIPHFIKNTLLQMDNLKEVQLFHAGQVFLDNLEVQENQEEVFLNLNDNVLEIAVYKASKLHLYNHFVIESVEDFLYYVLVVINQLDLDPNELHLKTFGQITNISDYYKQLKKHVRHINLGLKDEHFCEHFTLYNLF